MTVIENCKYKWKEACCPQWIGSTCNEECIRTQMTNDMLLSFEHGSTVYGTNNENSDVDIVIVVPDKYSDFLDNFEKSIYQFKTSSKDYEFVTKSNYVKLIKNYDIMAIESLFLPKKNIINGNLGNYRKYFVLDKWKIRQSFSGTASNSWAKAHKKMTVEKDFDMYTGQKSLFHSLRILDFANQLCEHGRIIDYSSINSYWKDICNEKEPSWEKYKKKYKPVYNSLRSKLVELAPKPCRDFWLDEGMMTEKDINLKI